MNCKLKREWSSAVCHIRIVHWDLLEQQDCGKPKARKQPKQKQTPNTWRSENVRNKAKGITTYTFANNEARELLYTSPKLA